MIKIQPKNISKALFAIFLVSSLQGFSQGLSSITIDSCYTMANRNYPAVKQFSLIDKSKDYSISNASKGYLPQLNIAGQATYQSDVTSLPISIPNINVPKVSKDQYKVYGEVAQPITNLFTIKDQKALIAASSTVDHQKLAAELYNLKERINQLYFGILLIDAQLKQTDLLKMDIQIGIDKTNAAIANGVALKSNLDILNAELLNVDQKTIQLKANRKGFTDMLSLFINATINEKTILMPPPVVLNNAEINRPELKLYDAQKNTLLVQRKLLKDKNLPQFNLFFQGGYGKPALNMLNNDFTSYYIGGLKLNWNIAGFYTYGKERKINTLNQNMIDLQKETFLFNVQLNLHQQNSELAKIKALIKSDSDIVLLRDKIKNTAKKQLELGVVTPNDYLSYINAEDQAKQNLILHQIQLLMAQYNYQTISGN